VAEPVELQLPVRQVVRVQDHVAGEEPGHVLQVQCCGTGTVTFCRSGTVTFCSSGTVTFCRSRNQNRNLITDFSGNETETVIYYGSGTVIKWNHKSSHRDSIKLCI
jgi:hypothetical protein